MHYSYLLLTLASTASAVNMILFGKAGCSGVGVKYSNIPAHACVAVPGKSFNAVLFQKKKKRLSIEGRVYSGAGCAIGPNFHCTTGSNPSCCRNAGATTGASWIPTSQARKRSDDEMFEDSILGRQTEDGDGESGSFTPTEMILEDGTTVSLDGVSVEQMNQMLDLAFNNETLPAEFVASRKTGVFSPEEDESLDEE